MNGRIYTAVFKDIAVTALQDLFEIVAGANVVVIIHGWLLSQRTEVGDAAEEQLLLTTNRGIGAVTSGSGGSVAPGMKLSAGDSAADSVVEVNNTTKMVVGSGTLQVDLEVHNWNVRIPYPFWYPERLRPTITPSDRWTLELETVPADSINMSGTLWYEEIGS